MLQSKDLVGPSFPLSYLKFYEFFTGKSHETRLTNTQTLGHSYYEPEIVFVDRGSVAVVCNPGKRFCVLRLRRGRDHSPRTVSPYPLSLPLQERTPTSRARTLTRQTLYRSLTVTGIFRKEEQWWADECRGDRRPDADVVSPLAPTDSDLDLTTGRTVVSSPLSCLCRTLFPDPEWVERTE